MLSVVADVLKSRLTDLPWIERFGGLVQEATRPQLIRGADGVDIIKGYDVYPVACDVNLVNCWEGGRYKMLEPDSTKAAVAFFTDGGGVTLKSVDDPKESWMVFSFELRFLCWMNLMRLGETITAGGCQPSGRVVPYVVHKLWGDHTASGLFGGGLEEEVFGRIRVTAVSELQKRAGIFDPFSFARSNMALFIYPYDYFGLRIQGTFEINRNCLPEFGVYWEPEISCLSPDGSAGTPGNGTSNWFANQFQQYVDSLDFYDSNESATTALEAIYGVGNAVGKLYKAGYDPAHNAATAGTIMVVVP